HDGEERSYYLYTPQTIPTRLMILLHPVASSGYAMAVETDFNTVADHEGYLVLYPNALHSVWDDGRLAAGLPPLEDSIDDVGYLATLAEAVAADYDIATDQIYLA